MLSRLDEVRECSKLIWPVSFVVLSILAGKGGFVLNILYFGIKMMYGTGFFTDNWRDVLVCEVR